MARVRRSAFLTAAALALAGCATAPGDPAPEQVAPAQRGSAAGMPALADESCVSDAPPGSAPATAEWLPARDTPPTERPARAPAAGGAAEADSPRPDRYFVLDSTGRGEPSHAPDCSVEYLIADAGGLSGEDIEGHDDNGLLFGSSPCDPAVRDNTGAGIACLSVDEGFAGPDPALPPEEEWMLQLDIYESETTGDVRLIWKEDSGVGLQLRRRF